MVLSAGERHGISAEGLSVADKRLYIPIVPDVESLNVGVAASIVLYSACSGGQRRGHAAAA